ncbi:MAG: TolC family protein, partial [Ferruginibacter sp.]
MVPFLMRRCFPIVSILLLIQAPFVFAQTKKYSLLSLIDSAHNYLPVLMQKKALVESGKAAIIDTKHSFLPQVKFGEQLNLGSANSLAGSFFTFGMTPSTSGSIRSENIGQPAAGNVAVLYSEYELDNFGLNQAKLNTARAYLNLAETDLKKEQYFLDLNVAKLYFNILRNQYRLSADRQNIDRYQSIFNVIQALTAAGIKPG